MEELSDYRDIQIREDLVSFFVCERSDITESPAWRRVAQINFNIADGTYSRVHITDLDSGR